MEGREEKIRFVIDTNVIFTAIISRTGPPARIIIGEYALLYAPEFMLDELEKYKLLLFRKGKYSTAGALEVVLEKILTKVTVIPEGLYADALSHALEVTPDPKDAPFIALAMKMDVPLWTNDRELKKVDAIKVVDTEEVMNMLGMVE
ncbi:PIN domain-containing protein [Thermococcus sp.]